MQRFVKDIARAGSIVRRTDGSRMAIDRAWLQVHAEEFGRMKTNGGRVPIPAGHTFDPEKSRGWVEDMWVSGDRLVASIDLIGDGIRLAGTNQVSIYAKRIGKEITAARKQYKTRVSKTSLKYEQGNTSRRWRSSTSPVPATARP